MKKLLIFALAAFVFVACGKDDKEPVAVPHTIEFANTDGSPVAKDGEGVVIDEAVVGVTVHISAAAVNNHHEFTTWESTSPGVTFNSATSRETTFVMPDHNVTLKAVYEAKPYTVYVMDGTASAEGVTAASEVEILSGETVTLTFTGSLTANQAFRGWKNAEDLEDEFEDVVFDDVDGTTFVMPNNDVSIEPVIVDVYMLTLPAANFEASVDGTAVESGEKLGEGDVVMLTWTGDVPTGQFLAGFETDADPALVFTAVDGDALSFTFPMPAANLEVLGETFENMPTVTVRFGTSDVAFAMPGDEITVTLGDNTDKKIGEFVTWHSSVALTTTGGTALTNEVFKFTMPASDVVVGPEYDFGQNYPHIAYVDDLGVLNLGKWGTDVTEDFSNMLATMPGSLMGMVFTTRPSTFLFAPVDGITFNAPHPSWYNQEPDGFTDADGIGYVSSAAWHNNERLAQGRGDICQLAGLTADEAKEMIAAGKLQDYYSGFRLPTEAEARAWDYKISNPDEWLTGAAGDKRVSLVIDGDEDALLPGCGDQNWFMNMQWMNMTFGAVPFYLTSDVLATYTLPGGSYVGFSRAFGGFSNYSDWYDAGEPIEGMSADFRNAAAQNANGGVRCVEDYLFR